MKRHANATEYVCTYKEGTMPGQDGAELLILLWQFFSHQQIGQSQKEIA